MNHAFPITHANSWMYRSCKYCGGDLFWVEDTLDSYWECLQCSHHQMIKDKFADMPKRDKRWRIDLKYLSEIGKTGDK